MHSAADPIQNRDANEVAQAMRASDLFVQVMQRVLLERLVAEAAHDSISLTQLLALRYIWLHNNVLIGHIAEGLHVSYPSVTNLINRMERAGLVVREHSEHDRREVQVRLTEEGRATIEMLERERIRRFDSVIQSMAPKDREALLSGLAAFVVAAVGEDSGTAEDICLRCGRGASADCPIAQSHSIDFCR
jgi:DNA-binding MarR family transcriptional regulator